MESGAFRKLPESEQRVLQEKQNLLYDIANSLNDFCSEAFGREKYSVRNTLVNYSKSSKLNIVKTFVRNLSFMRKH